MDILALILWLMIIFSGLLVIANIVILFRSYFKDRDVCDFSQQIDYMRRQIASLQAEVDALKLKIRKKKGDDSDA